jgi:hypothetical protein
VISKHAKFHIHCTPYIKCKKIYDVTNRQKGQNYIKKSLKIPKGQSESVYQRRTDNTMAKRKSKKGINNDLQNIHITHKIE